MNETRPSAQICPKRAASLHAVPLLRFKQITHMMEGFFFVCVCVKEDKFVGHHFKLNFPTFAQIAHIEIITSNQLCNTM